jgi:hypothetical protein
MQSIIRRFDRAPLEGKLLRANPAQPAKGKTPGAAAVVTTREQPQQQRRRPKRSKDKEQAHSAFAAELAKAL